MSELRSLVGSLRAESLAALADAAVEEDFLELSQACEQLEVERLRRLREVERRGTFRRDGHLSIAAWLVSRLGVGWGSARRQVRLARALEHMPATRTALDESDISLDAARVLARAHRDHPEAFPSAEARLVHAARIHTVADLSRVCAFWSQRVEANERRDADDAGLRARRISMPRRRSAAWSGWTGNWTRRPARRSSQPWHPSWTRRHARGPRKTSVLPPNAAPMPWASSAVSGWTARIVPRSPANAPIWASRCRSMR